MTPDLYLDHCGCIVNDLASAAARWERLGFNLMPLSRQRGAVPGREGFHPWATANRCVILHNTYLELIGTVDAAAFNPWSRFISQSEGLHILALRCDDAQAAYAGLSARTDAFLPPVLRERILDVDGEPRTMRFRNIFSRDEVWPEARYLVIEHQTPEYLWQPCYQEHENGACELVAVTFVADDPVSLLPRMEALGAQVVSQGASGFSAKLAGGSVHVMHSASCADAYAHGALPGMHGITVSVQDLHFTLELIADRGIVMRTGDQGAYIGHEDTGGFVLHFVQDGAIS